MKKDGIGKTVCYDRSRRNLYPDRTFGACTEVTEQGKGIILCRQRKETEDAALVDAAVAFGIGQMKLEVRMPGGGSEVQSSFEAGRKAGKIVGNGLSLS